jgi:hypothetical protein
MVVAARTPAVDAPHDGAAARGAPATAAAEAPPATPSETAVARNDKIDNPDQTRADDDKDMATPRGRLEAAGSRTHGVSSRPRLAGFLPASCCLLAARAAYGPLHLNLGLDLRLCLHASPGPGRHGITGYRGSGVGGDEVGVDGSARCQEVPGGGQVALFAADAVVVDEGQTWRGTTKIQLKIAP